jgi:hypothetical protein
MHPGASVASSKHDNISMVLIGLGGADREVFRSPPGRFPEVLSWKRMVWRETLAERGLGVKLHGWIKKELAVDLGYRTVPRYLQHRTR